MWNYHVKQNVRDESSVAQAATNGPTSLMRCGQWMVDGAIDFDKVTMQK